jgi:hypothetical protein
MQAESRSEHRTTRAAGTDSHANHHDESQVAMKFTQRGTLSLTLVAIAALLTVGHGATAAADPGPSRQAEAHKNLPPHEFISDYTTALAITNQYWATHFSEYVPGGIYNPPGLLNIRPDLGLGFYDAIGTTDDRTLSPDGDRVPCGTIQLYDNNAIYCGLPFAPGSDYIAFDYSFMNRAHTLGDMFIYFVVAHEWAHAIQARVDASAHSQRYELQADCIAGGTISGMVNDGALILDAGDSEELWNILIDRADQFEWTKIGDHGSAAQRINAYNQGANYGVNSCWNFV